MNEGKGEAAIGVGGWAWIICVITAAAFSGCYKYDETLEGEKTAGMTAL